MGKITGLHQASSLTQRSGSYRKDPHSHPATSG